MNCGRRSAVDDVRSRRTRAIDEDRRRIRWVVDEDRHRKRWTVDDDRRRRRMAVDDDRRHEPLWVAQVLQSLNRMDDLCVKFMHSVERTMSRSATIPASSLLCSPNTHEQPTQLQRDPSVADFDFMEENQFTMTPVDQLPTPPVADQTPAPPASVLGDSAPWQRLSGELAPDSDSDRDAEPDVQLSDRGVESDLSRPESYLAATSFHAQITEIVSVPSQEEFDVEQTAARSEVDVVIDEAVVTVPGLSNGQEHKKSYASIVMVMKESNTPISVPTSKALQALTEIRRVDTTPSLSVHAILLRHLFKTGDSRNAWKLFQDMILRGPRPSVRTFNAMILGSCLKGRVAAGEGLFWLFPKYKLEPDACSFNIAMKGHCMFGRAGNAFKLFDGMLDLGHEPSIVSYNILINALCRQGKLEEARSWFDRIVEDGHEANIITYNVLLDVYVKAGQIDVANSTYEEDSKIVTIHAAMGGGKGLNYFQKKFPKRCIDVGIVEQHAVIFAAGLATEDLQKLPVRFAMDRARLDGADGPTHCGAFDIAYMACLPNDENKIFDPGICLLQQSLFSIT
ncbi:hypothetical protein KFK09_018651 [Dendrobium nobile]|uniref:Transketolase-like pyrimidine-binding domain-containing protein n=1 Tax=Dendrobium nobile TaxID=94219 RepID=A0A8T3AVU8_DENNO|nr:hypothetical protein KFK09_018651 [Dendrobium nobile]